MRELDLGNLYRDNLKKYLRKTGLTKNEFVKMLKTKSPQASCYRLNILKDDLKKVHTAINVDRLADYSITFGIKPFLLLMTPEEAEEYDELLKLKSSLNNENANDVNK